MSLLTLTGVDVAYGDLPALRSVSLTVEREFKGSDPTFRDTLSAADWAEYCDAFAAYPAIVIGA